MWKCVYPTMDIYQHLFTPKRNVMQGCPLSPTLFVITIKLLALYLKNSRKPLEIKLKSNILICRNIKAENQHNVGYSKDIQDIDIVKEEVKMMGISIGTLVKKRTSKQTSGMP